MRYVIFPLLFLALLLGGCTPISVTMRTLRFDSPETGGQRHIELAGLVGDTAEVYLGQLEGNVFSPANYSLVNLNEIHRTRKITFRAGFGLLSCADLFTEYGSLWGLKLALVGCEATPSDSGLRVAATAAAGSLSQRRDQTTGGYSYSSNLSGMLYDGSLNVGYRFQPSILVYSNVYMSQYRASAEFRQNGAILLAKSTGGTMTGVLPGVQFSTADQQFSLFLEAGYTRIAWRNIPATEFTSIGGGVRVRW